MKATSVKLVLNKQSEELLRTLEKYAGNVSVLNSMRAIGISYRKEVKAIFERRQVRSPSLKWDPLSTKYETQKEKKFPGKNMLDATGALKKSMTLLGAKGNISKVTHKSGSFGTSIPYANYHDDVDSPRTKIPLRNFSLPSQTSYGAWLNIISADLSAQLRRIGIISV